MAKIHLRANKLTGENRAVALCAVRTINGKLRTNHRETYRYMASEIIGFDDYKKIANKDRCAHCDGLIPSHNAKRLALGLRNWDMSDAAR